VADPIAGAPKQKKSVALSGVVAGNTALCTVGRTGNDLHYRGYDILDIADVCEFEEIAHLLVHGTLPRMAELAGYKAKLRSMRPIPATVMKVLEQLPSTVHPMDVMRTATSALGTAFPERDGHSPEGARDIADRLMASLGPMLLYWHHWSRSAKRIDVETDDDSIGGTRCIRSAILATRSSRPSRALSRAMRAAPECSTSPSGWKRSCGTQKRCSPTSTGIRR